jgi:hypothetical protein
MGEIDAVFVEPILMVIGLKMDNLFRLMSKILIFFNIDILQQLQFQLYILSIHQAFSNSGNRP